MQAPSRPPLVAPNSTKGRHACLLRTLGQLKPPAAPSRRSTAVCLTGQLRGLHIAAVNLWEQLLSQLRAPDLFYVGPADDWYTGPHGGALLRQLPGFVSELTYGRQLQFGRWPARREQHVRPPEVTHTAAARKKRSAAHQQTTEP